MKFEQLNESFSRLYGIDNLDEELDAIEEEQDNLEEGIFDKLKNKFNSKYASAMDDQADEYERKGDYLNAQSARKKALELKRKAELNKIDDEATGIEDHFNRRAQLYKDYADAEADNKEMYKTAYKSTVDNFEKHASEYTTKRELDRAYTDYLASIRKKSKQGLSISDPLYKDLRAKYLEIRDTLPLEKGVPTSNSRPSGGQNQQRAKSQSNYRSSGKQNQQRAAKTGARKR